MICCDLFQRQQAWKLGILIKQKRFRNPCDRKAAITSFWVCFFFFLLNIMEFVKCLHFLPASYTASEALTVMLEKKSRGPKNVIWTPDTSVSVVIPVHPWFPIIPKNNWPVKWTRKCFFQVILYCGEDIGRRRWGRILYYSEQTLTSRALWTGEKHVCPEMKAEPMTWQSQHLFKVQCLLATI